MVDAALSVAAARRWRALAAGAAALAFIAVMVATGSERESAQLVRFEAKGVMQSAPDQVSWVEIDYRGATYRLVRRGSEEWMGPGGVALDEKRAADANLAVQFMNTSGPARELTAAELPASDLKPFGLDAPRLSVRLFAGSVPVLGARFGALNPGGSLQYMQVEGRDSVYLMSRFVGGQWERVARELGTR